MRCVFFVLKSPRSNLISRIYYCLWKSPEFSIANVCYFVSTAEMLKLVAFDIFVKTLPLLEDVATAACHLSVAILGS